MKDESIVTNQLDGNNILEVDVLKVVGNSLIYSNTIYQISNITSVELSSNSERFENPFPVWVKSLLVIGVILVVVTYITRNSLDTNIPFIIGILSIASFLISYIGYIQYEPYSELHEYGLSIVLTSGQNPVFVSDNEHFIKQIVISLYQVISDDKNRDKAIVYNFVDNNISHESNFKIGSVHGSNLVGGDVSGDVVNNI